jgi:hypothetical protein
MLYGVKQGENVGADQLNLILISKSAAFHSKGLFSVCLGARAISTCIYAFIFTLILCYASPNV